MLIIQALQRVFQLIIFEKDLNEMILYTTKCTDRDSLINEFEVKLLDKYVHLSKWIVAILSVLYKVTGYAATLFPVFLNGWYLLINISVPYVEYVKVLRKIIYTRD